MIKLNGLNESSISDIVLFTNIPNIIEYSNSDVGGTRARLKIIINGAYKAIDKDAKLTVNGDTVVTTTDINQCNGRYFYAGSVREWVCPTLVDALRNCPNVAANYNVYIDNDDSGDLYECVVIEAKETGSKYDIEFDIDAELRFAASKGYIGFNHSGGSSPDILKNTKSAKVRLQLYKIDDVRYKGVSSPISKQEYVTTLQKNYYKDCVKFDISPVLSSIVEYGKLTYIRFVLSIYTSDPRNPFQDICSRGNIYVTYGYRSNSSLNYVPNSNVPCLMQNVGNGIEWANNTTLYLYKPIIQFSWLNSTASDTFTVKYLDSAYRQIYGENKTLSNSTIDKTIELMESKLKDASYISIELPQNRGNLLYSIIKGIDAADKCHRIYWRNEMGGISFFDFTGQYQSEIEIENETYNKGNLNYYSDNEYEVVYSKDIKHSNTVTTHLIDKNGTDIFESLSRSHSVWVEDDETSEIKYIIIDDVSVSQDSNYDDVYTASVQFHYSREK